MISLDDQVSNIFNRQGLKCEKIHRKYELLHRLCVVYEKPCVLPSFFVTNDQLYSGLHFHVQRLGSILQTAVRNHSYAALLHFTQGYTDY